MTQSLRTVAVLTVSVLTNEPDPEPTTPQGLTSKVVCNDGTLSESGGKPGACAWHGGVDWDAAP